MNKNGLRTLNEISKKYKELFLYELKNKTISLEDVNTCICCGSKDLEKLLDVDRFGLPFGTYICQNCGLVITSPRIKQEFLPHYYNKYYHPLNYGKEGLDGQSVLFFSGQSQGVKIYNKLESYIINKKNITVLEIGAGVGNVLADFREKCESDGVNVEILGTEYSSGCIVQCGKRNVNVIKGSSQNVMDVKKKFDLIILSHVFEHFIDLGKELEVLKGLLNEGGYLYIEVPGILKNHNKAYYDFSFLGYSVHAHMYNFSLLTLKNIVRQHGFYLKSGNENVEAIFQLNENIENEIEIEIENDNPRIKHYLDFLEENQSYAIKQNNELLEEKCKVNEKNNELDELESYINKLESHIKHIVRINVVLQPITKYKAYKSLLKVINEAKNKFNNPRL